MKRVIISAAAFFVMGISAAFATGGFNQDAKVKENFHKEFPRASNEQWAEENGYFKVSFVLNDVRVIAYFDHEGQMQGYVSAVFLEQLPIAVRTAIEKRFAGAVVVEIFEITNAENTRYKFLLEHNGDKHIAFVYHDGTIASVQK